MASLDLLRQSLPSLSRLVRRFGSRLRRERTLVAGGSLALLLEIGLRLLEPWPLKFVFDRVMPVEPSRGRPDLPLLESLDPIHLLALSAVAVIAITGLRALASYASTVAFALIGNRVVTGVRSELFEHIQRLSLSFHDKARSGELLNRLTGDIGLLKEVAITAALPFVANALTLVGMLAVMFWLDWRLALLATAVLPIFSLAAVRSSRRIRDAARIQRRREGAMAATASEALGAIKTVQALSLEGALQRVFEGENRRSLTEGVRGSRLAARLERGADALIAVSTALVLGFGGWLALTHALTPGELLVFLTYLKSAFKPVRDFAKYTGRLSRAAAAGERVLELLDQSPDVTNRPDAIPAGTLRGAVRLERVSFAYQPGCPTLQEIELVVEPGQRVALVGPSGGGKSTITSLLLRLYDPSSGRVLVDGRDIREYTVESLRGQISVVLQDTILFAATVRENIAYGAPEVSRGRVEEAAQLAGAHEFIERLPDGYLTPVGERGVTLSNGQRQRLAVARAAVRDAPILILDEPTVSLDEANARVVAAALGRLAERRTTFFVTHDLHHAAGADLILYLDQGQIVERGTHAELLRAGGRYAALYRLQAAARRRGREHEASHEDCDAFSA